MGNVDYVPLHCTQNDIPGFDSPTRERQPSRANTGVKPSGHNWGIMSNQSDGRFSRAISGPRTNP